jgi:hypothetical protein
MVIHNVVCDGCGKECVGFPPLELKKRGSNRDKLHKIRYMYSLCGWRVNLPGGKDYCPECWEKMKDEGKRF